MITLLDLAASIGRDPSSLRRRATRYGIEVVKATNPGTNQTVLALDAANEKKLRALYPAVLKAKVSA